MSGLLISQVALKPAGRGGTGALAAFLAGSAERAGAAHHLVWSLFEDLGGKRPFLYRLHGATAAQPITLVSDTAPADGHGLWDIQSKPYALLDAIRPGDRIAWSLRVNATVRHTGSSARHCIVTDDRRRNGRLPSRTYAGREESAHEVAERVVPAWLAERLRERAGLDISPTDVRISAHRRHEFEHAPGSPQKGRVTLSVTDAGGLATVRDPDALRAAVLAGIGAGCAYGCGMLLVRRA